VDDADDIQLSVSERRVEWRRHALERLLERGFARADVFSTVASGEIIESDRNRKPLPTFLWFATVSGRRIHVVVAWNRNTRTAHFVTVYEPDEEHFENDFRTRRLR
jgi:hypothetical protein